MPELDEQLRAIVDASVEPLRLDQVIGRPATRSRGPRWRVTVAVAALASAAVVAAAVGSTGGGSRQTHVTTGVAPTTVGRSYTPSSGLSTLPAPTPTSPSGSSTTTAPADPAAALESLANSYGPSHTTSEVTPSSGGDLAAVSYNVATATAGTHPHVAIFTFVSGAWTKVSDVTLDIGGVILPTATKSTPIFVVHLTGSATPDFAVTVSYNSGPAAAIVAETSGSWHPLGVGGGPHGGDEIINPTFTATSVTERSNSCTPDCAAGNYITTTYRYSSRTGRMQAIS